jgi:hypothetical protein
MILRCGWMLNNVKIDPLSISTFFNAETLDYLFDNRTFICYTEEFKKSTENVLSLHLTYLLLLAK